MPVNQMKLDTKGFEKVLRKIEIYGGSIEKEVEKALSGSRWTRTLR